MDNFTKQNVLLGVAMLVDPLFDNSDMHTHIKLSQHYTMIT